MARNNPCPCGSGKKYKNCCRAKGRGAVPQSVVSKEGRGPVPEAHHRRFSLLVISVIILLGGIIYFNTLNAPFTFDDALIQLEREAASLKAGELQGTVTHLSMIKVLLGRSRPVANLSFYFNYLLGKDDPFGYHLTNIIIHLLSAIIVFFFLQATLNLPRLRARYQGQGTKVAAIASVLFVTHPVHTQAVNFVVQRMASMMAMFYLVSLLFYLNGRITAGRKRIFFYITSTLFALLAFGSKQNAATLPFFIVLFELYFFQGLEWQKIKRKLSSFLVILSVPIILSLIYTDFQFLAKLSEGYQERPFTMGQRVITEFRVIVYYFSLLLYPHPSRLNLDYDFPLSHSLINPPTTLVSLLIILGLLWVTFYLMKRRPVVSFCFLWFLGHLVIESTIYPLDLVYEHRLYLPSIGVFLLLALLFVRFLDQKADKAWRRAGSVVISLLILLLCWGTYQRNFVWQSEIGLWEDVVRKSPHKARPHNNLGKAYASAALADKKLSRLSEKAIEEYKKAIELNPRNFVAHDNLGQAYGRKGMHREAIKACREAVRLNPNYLQAYNNLGVAYNKIGMHEEAIKACLEALRIKPNYAKSYFNLGKGYEGLKEYDKAIEAFNKAWTLMPDNADIPYNIGNEYFNKGMFGKSKEYYLTALKIKPNFVDAYYNLGVIYFNTGKYKKAVQQYRKIIEVYPAYAPAYERLGILYMEKFKDYKNALDNFKKTIMYSKNEKDATLARRSIKRLESKGYKIQNSTGSRR